MMVGRGSWHVVAVAGAALWAACVGLACDDGGQPALSGLDEPFQAVGAQFISGDLPGTPPPDGGAEEGGPTPQGPLVTDISLANQIVSPGEAGKNLGGHASGAASVGVKFADMGTGFWITPVAEPDALYMNENAFQFTANFSVNNPAGLHNLRFVGIDSSGKAGEQNEIRLCLKSRIPDNLHSCNPNAAPPSAVITLEWDTNFDVDLHVFTPKGVDINPKAPLGLPVDGGSTPDPNAPRIDRDSLGNCVPDGLRQEDLVFQDPPPPGPYDIYADPFASCGQTSVRFKLTVYRTMGTCPACSLQSVYTQAGELLNVEPTGGASTGLFIHEIAF